MHPLSAVLISVFVYCINASWLGDLTSANGLSFGDGVALKMEDNKANNSSFLERLALRVDNENVGISMAQNAERKAVDLDFYVKDKVEGRGKKMGHMVVPLVVGAAGAGAMTVAIGGIKVMVMKALMIAKIALMFSIILLIGKLMKEKESIPHPVEIEHHAASEVYPVYTDYSHSVSGGGNGYGPSGSGGGGGGYGAYSYGPSAAESVLNYATVEAPGGNGSVASLPIVQQILPAAKRRDYRRRSRPMLLTITHITEPDKNGLL